jgi:hypothetical protein
MKYGNWKGWGGAAVLLCLGWGSACARGDEPKGDEDRSVPVQVTVKTDKKVYRSGDPIKMTLTAKNTQKSDVVLRFSSGQQYDIEIRRGKNKNGEKVWQWAEGRMFTLALVNTTLQSGKTQTYNVTYGIEMSPTTGKPVPKLTPGTYTIVATLTTMGRTPRPFGTTTFTVK